MSWSGLVYYGETLGFVLAWVAGIVALSAFGLVAVGSASERLESRQQ